MIRTLVCATSTLVRAGLVTIVRGDRRLELAGDAAPSELVARIRALDPDVVLEEREADGTALAVPSVALVDDPHLAWLRDQRESERGARAILARDAAPEEIVAAIVAVAAGLVAVQPRALAPFDRSEFASERLTVREIDVLGELARGVPNKMIAGRLHISEHTVKFHVASIFAKLGVASRTEAVTQGVRLGLIML